MSLKIVERDDRDCFLKFKQLDDDRRCHHSSGWVGSCMEWGPLEMRMSKKWES